MLIGNVTRKYRPKGIRVTDLAAQLWCEKQLEFSLEKEKLETNAMREGVKRHEELHKEIADLVQLETSNKIDNMALISYNLIIGLERLIKYGMTRELPIFGKINSLFVVGIVDELYFEGAHLFIQETKTRRKNKMPTGAQKRVSRFQLMIYNKLIRDLVGGSFAPRDLLRFYGIKGTDGISMNLKKQCRKKGVYIKPNIKPESCVII